MTQNGQVLLTADIEDPLATGISFDCHYSLLVSLEQGNWRTLLGYRGFIAGVGRKNVKYSSRIVLISKGLVLLLRVFYNDAPTCVKVKPLVIVVVKGQSLELVL